MANNNLLTNDIILKTALMEYENNLVLAKTARRTYEDKFNNTTGASIRVRKPTRYTARVGTTTSVQAINEQYTNITVGDMIGVDVQVSSTQFALQLDDFNREVINPAMVTLANKVDSLLYATTTQFFNFAGTAGVGPASYGVASQAQAVLDAIGVPANERFLLLKSFDSSTLKTALYNSFNENFNKSIIMNGSMGNLSGFDCYSVQNAIRPSRGSDTLGTAAIAGAGQSGLSLNLDGLAANAQLKAGALFTIAGVNLVNPTSREDTGQLAQFSVKNNVQADGAGLVTIELGDANAITLTGPYQTVTALPADNALVTFQATHTKNIFYHREAFAFVSVRLPESNSGVWQKNMRDSKANVSIRMTRQYQITDDVEVIRFDILPAVKCFPQYGGVLMGS